MTWFRSYLSNREQYVSVNGYNSNNLNVTCGVLQGSVLGPLLFLIYINDIPNTSSKLAFYLFADDTSIYFESGNLEQLQKVVKCELKHVKKWLDANKLALRALLLIADQLLALTKSVLTIQEPPTAITNFSFK